MDFGNYLKGLIDKRKYSFRKLATLADIDHTYISKIVRGKMGPPSPDILKRLAKPLNVSYEELMVMAGYLSPDPGRTNNPVPPNISAFRSPQEARLIENYRKSDDSGRKLIVDVSEHVSVKDDEQAATET